MHLFPCFYSKDLSIYIPHFIKVKEFFDNLFFLSSFRMFFMLYRVPFFRSMLLKLLYLFLYIKIEEKKQRKVKINKFKFDI